MRVPAKKHVTVKLSDPIVGVPRFVPVGTIVIVSTACGTLLAAAFTFNALSASVQALELERPEVKFSDQLPLPLLTRVNCRPLLDVKVVIPFSDTVMLGLNPDNASELTVVPNVSVNKALPNKGV